MKPVAICPCGGFEHPRIVLNPPGRSVLAYRVGDFAAFRQALLTPAAEEKQLAAWRPSARGDLGVQVVEWWAYIAEILAFYNERYAQESYLRTAQWAESVQGLVRLLGYRPQPGIGATGVLAALLSGSKPVLIPAGFAVQSKPGPGESPQTFEVEAATWAEAPDAVGADMPPDESIQSSLMLAGEVTSIREGDRLLLINDNWDGGAGDLAHWLRVNSLKPVADPRGRKNTLVGFSPAASVPSSLKPASLRLLRGAAGTTLWPYDAATVVAARSIHLSSPQREIAAGSFVLVERLGANAGVVEVDTATEMLWYANTSDTNNPAKPPTAANTPAIGIPHTVLTFKQDLANASTLDNNRGQVRVRHDWREAGRVIAKPAGAWHAQTSGDTLTLRASGTAAFPAVQPGQEVLLEDAGGAGAVVRVVSGTSRNLTVEGMAAGTTLTAPVRVLFNLLKVSRGKTVAQEVLGSGDSTQAAQEMTLKKSPLTYLAATEPGAVQPYESTLELYVDGVAWSEARSFYGQPEDARVFVTREDAEGKTHIAFGDGVRGSRLPTGSGNVLARYRHESGAQSPAAGRLTILAGALEGLRAVVNPVAAGGGDDADSPDKLRTLAPRSVLTFQRAVSTADYEALALATPGVDRARAYWSFEAALQRPVVKVYVGDRPDSVSAARVALSGAMDPNRPLTVLAATGITLGLHLQLILEPGYLEEPVVAAVREALTGTEAGLFSIARARIGQTLFRSQILGACHSAAGVQAVHSLQVRQGTAPLTSYKMYAGEGGYFTLSGQDLTVTTEVGDAF